MKKILWCLFIFVNMGYAGAQTFASGDLLFAEYQDGIALLRDGSKAPAKYNYSTVNKQIQYLGDQDVIMTFRNPKEVSVVNVAGRVFENTPEDGFLERIPVGSGFYYVQWGAKWISGGKDAGFGHRSQSASTSSYAVSSSETTAGSAYDHQVQNPTAVNVSGSVNGMRVTHKDGMQTIPEYAYFLKINDKFKRFDSANSLAKALGCCKNEIQEFVKKERINFKEPEAVHRMMLLFVANSTPQPDIYGFTVKDIDGNDFAFSSLKGKKIMIVNVASKCGHTPQYALLQDLYEKYRYDNFTIVAFPANNFGAQEPGSNPEIRSFCSINYGVTFPLMAKISVKGDDIAPIYKWLTNKAENEVAAAEVTWNFQKFLIDEQGRWVKTIPPGTSPRSEEIIAWIEGKSPN